METIIKKIKIIFIVLLSILSFSCSKDDNDNSSTSTIVGKWILVSEKEIANGELISENNWEHLCSSSQDYVQFNQNGNFDWVEYNSNCSINNSGSTNQVTWSQSGNIITFTGDTELTTAEIQTLTQNTLVIIEELTDNNITYKLETTLSKSN